MFLGKKMENVNKNVDYESVVEVFFFKINYDHVGNNHNASWSLITPYLGNLSHKVHLYLIDIQNRIKNYQINIFAVLKMSLGHKDWKICGPKYIFEM